MIVFENLPKEQCDPITERIVKHLIALLLIVSQAFGESVLRRKRAKEANESQQKQKTQQQNYDSYFWCDERR